MNSIIPEKLKTFANKLSAPLYVVGGACRDFISGLFAEGATDWDICAPVAAEEVGAIAEAVGFKVGAAYKNTGTVRMTFDGSDCEFTSFRTDRYVRGRHSPAEVFFTNDIVSDALRRDFKCNAVYYDIAADKFVDPLGGIEDIEAKRITTVAPAEKVFGEDGLRLMRLCRIAAQTGFTPTEECVAGAYKNRRLIADIAPERIWTELEYILTADLKYGVKGGQYKGIKLLKETGVLGCILPELAAGDGMAQREDYHAYDVLEHTARCVLYAPPTIRLAALLHDVGKPYCKLTTGRYARHEEEGARIAAEICARLRVPKKVTERTCELVRWHMYDLRCDASENKVRKFIVSHFDILQELLLLKQSDYSACKDALSPAPCVAKWKNIYAQMLKEGVPLNIKQLAVRGDELIGAGICPNETAKTLKFLLGECVIGNVPNEKDRLIRYALARRA